MKTSDHHLSSTDTPIIADRILQNYKRDRYYFEHYSPKFNSEFLVHFEEKVDTLLRLTPLQELEKEIAEKNEKIQIIIHHFQPLLKITEALLQRATEKQHLIGANLSLNQLRESVNKKCICEIQKNCRKMVSELDLHVDDLIDKGFILRILDDFYLLMEKLRNCETELAEVTLRYDIIANEHLLVNSQLEDVVEAIIESIPAVLGENNTDKRDEYSIEKIMMQAQFMRSKSH